MQRMGMMDKDFVNLMTPYFARHEAVREGMLELHNLFLGSDQMGPDGFFCEVPPEEVTYDRMLSILSRIRDGIEEKDDVYPPEEYLQNTRARYCRYLKSGVRMPLMAEVSEDEAWTA